MGTPRKGSSDYKLHQLTAYNFLGKQGGFFFLLMIIAFTLLAKARFSHPIAYVVKIRVGSCHVNVQEKEFSVGQVISVAQHATAC